MIRRVILTMFFVVLALAGCQDKRVSVPDAMPWHQGPFAEAQSAAENQALMVFFETEW